MAETRPIGFLFTAASVVVWEADQDVFLVGGMTLSNTATDRVMVTTDASLVIGSITPPTVTGLSYDLLLFLKGAATNSPVIRVFLPEGTKVRVSANASQAVILYFENSAEVPAE